MKCKSYMELTLWQVANIPTTQKQFLSQLENLFDISHANSKNLTKISEDWVFLQDQLKARIIFCKDKMFAEHEQRKQKRMSEECKRLQKANNLVSSSLKKDFTLIFDDEEEDDDDWIGEVGPEPEIRKYHRKLIENKIDFCTEEPGPSN